METIHDYTYQCVYCTIGDFTVYYSPCDDCPACDVKYKWDYLSTLMRYKIGIDKWTFMKH